MKSWFFAVCACLALGACQNHNMDTTAGTTGSVMPVTPPSNSGLNRPGSTLDTLSHGGSQQMPTGGMTATTPAATGPMTGTGAPQGGARYTRPPMTTQ
jgi:hypothetical protein